MLVYKAFASEGAGEEWQWKLAVGRRFMLSSLRGYRSEAAARRAGRRAARECGL